MSRSARCAQSPHRRPSTTRAAMIASRYSVYQSSSSPHARARRPAAPSHRRAPRNRHRADRDHDRHQVRRRAGAVDEQRLGGAADAGAAHLGVERDGARHAHVGVAIDIHVAVAFEVSDHRHARLLLHPRHQTLAAARHDDVEILAHPGKHVADCGPIGGGHELDARRRQPRRLEPLRQAGIHRGVGMPALGAAAQDHCVARLQAQRAGIRGHVGTTLVDDADDTERHHARAGSSARSAAATRPSRARSDRAAR